MHVIAKNYIFCLRGTTNASALKCAKSIFLHSYYFQSTLPCSFPCSFRTEALFLFCHHKMPALPLHSSRIPGLNTFGDFFVVASKIKIPFFHHYPWKNDSFARNGCLARLVWVFCFVLFLWYGVWTQGLQLQPLCQPFFMKGFLRYGLTNYLPGLASNHDPPDLCLPTSYDYRWSTSAWLRLFFFRHAEDISTVLCVCVTATQPHISLTMLLASGRPALCGLLSLVLCSCLMLNLAQDLYPSSTFSQFSKALSH
jgi:hypothetical protein